MQLIYFNYLYKSLIFYVIILHLKRALLQKFILDYQICWLVPDYRCKNIIIKFKPSPKISWLVIITIFKEVGHYFLSTNIIILVNFC